MKSATISADATSFLATAKSLFVLAFPIILGQLGQMLIGAGDVYVASLHSVNSVAAIGVANGFINPVFLFGIGAAMGVSPALAMKIGGGQNMRSSLSSTLAFALLLGSGLSVVMSLFGGFFVDAAGIAPELVAPAKEYISIVAWSFPFAIMFQAGKEYLQAFEEVVFPNLLILGAVVLNVFVNYFLVFGALGFDGLGVVGLAWASCAVRAALFVVLLLYLVKEKWTAPNRQTIKDIFKLGLPTGFMFFLEVLAFCAVSVLSGKLGVVSAAANNIIMTISSIAFMIPLSISSAASVKVGRAHGANDIYRAVESAKAGVVVSLAFACASAALFYFFPRAIMDMASADGEVVSLGVRLLFIVALFQIADALQVVLAGVLRGVELANQTTVMVFIGHWMLGVPLGSYLAFSKGWGVSGLWTGLACALTVLACALCLYFVGGYLGKRRRRPVLGGR